MSPACLHVRKADSQLHSEHGEGPLLTCAPADLCLAFPISKNEIIKPVQSTVETGYCDEQELGKGHGLRTTSISLSSVAQLARKAPADSKSVVFTKGLLQTGCVLGGLGFYSKTPEAFLEGSEHFPLHPFSLR